MSQRLAELSAAWHDASTLEVSVLITIGVAVAVVMVEWGWKALKRRSLDWVGENGSEPIR